MESYGILLPNVIHLSSTINVNNAICEMDFNELYQPVIALGCEHILY